ncbi:MAG TPA: VWA domain-containing protein [Cytophagaceae bacterium]|jgi:Ca-activated chloride channel family protein|nr:VWA domain-containing protein [Cytophagaceae bacterium]
MRTLHIQFKKALVALLLCFIAYGCSNNNSAPKYSGKISPHYRNKLSEQESTDGLGSPQYNQSYSVSPKDGQHLEKRKYDALTDHEPDQYIESHNTEAYNTIVENEFLGSKENPLSTFSIDVDGASYSNSRRFIQDGSLPPTDAVRIEEYINYFDYNYPQPKSEHPFSINTEVSDCPWNKEHKLIHIGLQGKRIPFEQIAPMNLVFLIDVSGSMSDANKLPLLKKSLSLLVDRMRSQDRIALTVYAGAAGLVLPSTSAADKQTIKDALENLNAGGSTAGGEGIILAYKVAKDNFIPNGINRVILATDGDFNIGSSSDGEMTRLIEEKRKEGTFISVLGFGMGNYKDSKMETIADNGNGNYFYIDNIDEAKKVLLTELDGTLYTIAKDVKLQLEFNPAKIKAYRLVGYENRLLKKEDFNNDQKDAGELGAGHSVTALYEVITTDSKEALNSKVDDLKYSQTTVNKNASSTNELMTVKFRYKNPKDTVSKLIVQTLADKAVSLENSSENFRFSAAVAEFGMILRDSKFKASSSFAQVIEMANNSKGKDEEGYRAEFVKLVKTSELLMTTAQK